MLRAGRRDIPASPLIHPRGDLTHVWLHSKTWLSRHPAFGRRNLVLVRPRRAVAPRKRGISDNTWWLAASLAGKCRARPARGHLARATVGARVRKPDTQRSRLLHLSRCVQAAAAAL